MINLIVDKENLKVGVNRTLLPEIELEACEFIFDNCKFERLDDIYILTKDEFSFAFYPVANTFVLFIKN